MGKTGVFETGLVLAAFLVVTAAIGLVLLVPMLEMSDIPAPAAKTQATEQEMEDAWQNLVDAIRREDQEEALRIAEWLDEQHGLKAHATEIVQDWCKLSGQEWDFCKEETDAK